VTVSDLKFVPCTKCDGPANTYGSRLPRSIYYFTEKILVRCNHCGDLQTFKKG